MNEFFAADPASRENAADLGLLLGNFVPMPADTWQTAPLRGLRISSAAGLNGLSNDR